jgi:hypothetical protein
MRVFAVYRDIVGKPRVRIGLAKNYVNGQWVFVPDPTTGRDPVAGRRARSFEACLPHWTGGLDATSSERIE